MLSPALLTKVRKKPVIVSAVRWLKRNDAKFGGNWDYSELIDGYTMDDTPVIYTLESEKGGSGHHGKDGDWIIVGVKGERYFCDNDIFLSTYDFDEDTEL